jgi:acetyltransferase EpsM
MKKAIILGGGGLGLMAAAILEMKDEYEVLGLLNDDIPKGTPVGKFKKIKVIGSTDEINEHLKDPDVYFINTIVRMHARKEMFEKLKRWPIPAERYINVIDPSASIKPGYCSIGMDVFIGPQSRISCDVVLSDHCILTGNSAVGHDTFVGEYAIISSSAMVGANIHVGKGSFIGMNSTIIEKVRIGDFAFIGAGAVVLKDVPDNCTVAGNPARILKHPGAI